MQHYRSLLDDDEWCGYGGFNRLQAHYLKSSQPGVNDDSTGPLEVFHLPSDHREPVNERSCRNQSIDFIAPIGDVQMGAARGDGIVDDNDPAGKFRPDIAVEPGPQPGALAGIAPLHAKDTTLQFQNSDRREEEGGRIFPTDPGHDICVGFATPVQRTFLCLCLCVACGVSP